FKRQALHAKRLQLLHPVSGRPMRFECAIPADMRAVIDALARDANIHWQDTGYESYAGFDDHEGFDGYGKDED
ncbi:MAG: RluA family pseudouridine synthase, partial [Gammaproteobacteria bacterium]|nr:RluA family pseudouridine synthase [Gammaproteobacteria bacterium]